MQLPCSVQKKSVDLRSDSVLNKSLSPLISSLRVSGDTLHYLRDSLIRNPKKNHSRQIPQVMEFPIGKICATSSSANQGESHPNIKHLTLGCLFFARDSNHHATDEKHGTHPHLVLWIQPVTLWWTFAPNSCGLLWLLVIFLPKHEPNKPKHHEAVWCPHDAPNMRKNIYIYIHSTWKRKNNTIIFQVGRKCWQKLDEIGTSIESIARVHLYGNVWQFLWI